MSARSRNATALGAVLPAILVGLLSPQIARDQSSGQSPRQLIEFLTHESPDRAGGATTFDCASVSADRAAARALAESGRTAIPALEEAIGAIESKAMGSVNFHSAGWLLDAYARVEGADAYPRLRRMDRNPALIFIRLDLDNALALSLRLTSYVSSSNLLAVVVDCTRPGEPRHTLNQFLLAWERNDRDWLEASLGPNARSALESLLDQKTWAAMRAEFWKRESRLGDAVGYRFEGGGRWSEPQETLTDPSEPTGEPQDASSPELEARFTDSSGKECGRHRLKFVRPPVGGPQASLPYLIDNPDLTEILRTTASCAVRNN
jgi:hypothetical protein